jgi:capsular exopolysaccharide synthesis family protein
MNKLADLENAHTQAQLERISAQATYEELKNLEVDSIPPSITDPNLLQLRSEYTRTKADYDEKSKVFKPNYPDMIQLKAKLDSLKDELNKAVDAAESDYRSALNRERNLRQLLNNQKANVATTSSNAILYNSLKIEVDNKRILLNSLVERQTETQVSARLGGIRASNISVIDPGEVPRNPIYPKKKLNLMLAFIFGLGGGIILCFLLEYLDNTVKGNEDIEKLFGLSSLGVVPYLPPDGMKKGKNSNRYGSYRYSYKEHSSASEDSIPEVKEIELVNYLYPQISISEDYRTIRTSLLLSHAGNPPKVLIFTSAMSQEGKSSTVINMAVSFAQLNERVLVIDADMRKPRIHKVFDVDNSTGLSGYLAGKAFIRNAIQKSSIDNVWILPAGLIPPNPAELLNSKKMKELIDVVRKGYDIILIDSPPVLAVVDSVIVSTLADGTVFIVKAGKTTYKLLNSAIEELNKANAKILGLVFNEIKAVRGEYYYMDYYRYRDYSYEETEETEAEEVD